MTLGQHGTIIFHIAGCGNTHVIDEASPQIWSPISFTTLARQQTCDPDALKRPLIQLLIDILL